MYIKGIDSQSLQFALHRVNNRFKDSWIEPDYVVSTKFGVKVKLRVQTSKSTFHRLGQSFTSLGNRRKLACLCWHGFGHVFREVFKINPHAVVRTAQITYRGGGDFNLRYGSSDRNIGSMMNPLYYSEACECDSVEACF